MVMQGTGTRTLISQTIINVRLELFNASFEWFNLSFELFDLIFELLNVMNLVFSSLTFIFNIKGLKRPMSLSNWCVLKENFLKISQEIFASN